MELQEYLDYVKTGKKIIANSPQHLLMHELLNEAVRITHKINNEHHTPEEIQELFSELTNQPINRTLGLIPPFNTDCGKNIHIGENVFINSGCKMQDQGGIYIGDDVLIGHNTCLLTLNHAKEPENIVVLNENKMLFLLKTASVDVLKDTLSKVSLEQANNLAQYAIDHQINDFEKADIIKARTGRDITKSILLERENKVD